jgi:hypothetical protein
MKSIFLIPILFLTTILSAQSLPKTVEKSFKTQFPNTEIEGWKDNNTYDPSAINEDGRDSASEDAQKRGLKDPDDPTEFYIYFRKDNIDWYSKFLLDGTFVIAHGKVDSLPKKVEDAITNEFKGQIIKKIGTDIQKVIVPSSETAIYRVFVHLKHGKTHIVKVNEKGQIIANTIK